jgi:hypothetical protein
MDLSHMYAPEKVRTVRFRPYLKGKGPSFTLHLYDVNASDDAGRYGVGYRLMMGRKVIFECLDSKGCPYGHHSVDGDKAVRNVMGWLTLKPGDTDADYFAAYSPEQLDFCRSYAEALQLEVMHRFGED